MHDAVALGNSATTRTIQANRVDLVEISHHAIPFGDIANSPIGAISPSIE
jgi:hypothetical protein